MRSKDGRWTGDVLKIERICSSRVDQLLVSIEVMKLFHFFITYEST